MYIWSYSTNESDTEVYIEYSNKFLIGCMAAYTYGDYFYFNNMIDNPKKHHIGFILNQRHDTYITSPFNIMKETFVSLPTLFVKNFLKHALIPISKLLLGYQESMYGINRINKRKNSNSKEELKKIELCRFCKNMLCH